MSETSPSQSSILAELAREFPATSTEEWRSKLDKDLKGKPYDKLVWKTGEGFDLEPMYRREDLAKQGLSSGKTSPGDFPFLRGNAASGNDWKLREEICTDSMADCVVAIREARKGGADEVAIVSSIDARGRRGVPLNTTIDLKELLQAWGDDQSIHFYCGDGAPAIFAMLGDDARVGHLDFDPIASLAAAGESSFSMDAAMQLAAQMIQSRKGRRVLSVNGAPFHNAGAGLVEELAIALAHGNEYLARLTEADLSVDEIAPAIEFHVSIGEHYFLEIARLRALRYLWATVVGEYGPQSTDAACAYIHGRGSNRNKTLFDNYNNMLRGTGESMAAILGTCDAVTVLPFYYPMPRSAATHAAFGERVARNTQHVLRNEAYLGKVADPAGGAYYLERATDEIARLAWEEFQKIEAEGGLFKALSAGTIQKRIESSRQGLLGQVAARRKIVLGTNQYPNQKDELESMSLDDAPHPIPDDATAELEGDSLTALQQLSTRASLPALVRAIGKAHPSSVKVQRLVAMRLSGEFESLRLATDSYARAKSRPRVHLLLTGNMAMRRARAGFASHFFGCAGYEITEDTFDSQDALLRTGETSDADILVLCSSDDDYAEAGASIVSALKKGNASRPLVVAGYPEACLNALRDAGVDEFIHMKSDVLSTLRSFQKRLGIEVST